MLAYFSCISTRHRKRELMNTRSLSHVVQQLAIDDKLRANYGAIVGKCDNESTITTLFKERNK